jgi:putative ABC transport system permease protein
MRSVLTALGIIIGVGAVIAMVGIGNGAKAQVEAQIASLGQNVILIFSGSTTSSGIRTGWGGAGTLKLEDAEAIRREVPGVIGVSEEVVSTTQVAAGNQNWFTRIFGESAEYFDIRQWPLVDGAPFTAQDVRSANKVCVIGRTTATQIYGNENPIGQILRIKNVPFTITGVLTPKGLSPQGVDQDDIVVMPYTSAMKRVSGGTTLRNINVQMGDPGQIAAAQQQIISLLCYLRHRRVQSVVDLCTLAHPDFDQLYCDRIFVQRSRWDFLWILSRAKSRRARSHRGIAVRIES